MNVKDFKDLSGNWVRYYQNSDNKRVYTVAGMLWGNMQNRTKVGGKVQEVNPCYLGCTCTFQDFNDFSEWCQSQVGYGQGFQLDKDILSTGCKEYSKDTVVFLPQSLNKLLVKRDRDRGEFPVGVSWSTEKGLFAAYCNNGEGKTVALGRYSTSEKAFEVYKKFKEATIKQQASKWRDQIDPRAYNALMAYEVLITD